MIGVVWGGYLAAPHLAGVESRLDRLENLTVDWRFSLARARPAPAPASAVHVGPVVVSRLGPAHHQHVTATSDTVNVTSRLLEVAKQQRASVIISEDLYVAAKSPGSSCGPIHTAELAIDVSIRGRAHGLRIRVWH